MNSDYGELVINAFLARDSIPVSNVLVRISGIDEDVKEIKFSLITGEDGTTEPIMLPAPPRALSLSPSPSQKPYYSYDIEVSAPGYFTKNIRNVAILSGTRTILPVNMIIERDGLEAPIGSLEIDSRENPYFY